LNASSVVEEGGRIFLKASQDAYVDGNGRIVTTGTRGGSVEVLGNRVAVTDNAEIDASGTNGGGRIMVGGDYQGKNPDIQNANITYFGPNANLKANATEVGDGGTVVVWSDDTTRAYGNISARGGDTGGNGGLVETSGKRYLDTPGIRVDVGAANGKGGTWLLDPSDINIVASGTTDVIYGGGEFSYGGSVGTLLDADLSAALAGNANVIVRTDYGAGGFGNISANNVIISGTGSLTLAAYGGSGATGNIDIYGGSVINLSGAGSFKALAGWDGSLTYDGSDVVPGTGNIKISESVILVSSGSIDLHAGNDITLGKTDAAIRTLIQSNGKTTVSAKNLSLYGGSAVSGSDGPYVMLSSDTEQKIIVEQQILLKAGSANSTFYGGFGSMMYGGSVIIKSGGEQHIEATDLTIMAGLQGHDNVASVSAYGSQTITLGIYGGAAGQLIITGGGDNTQTYGGTTSYGGQGSYNNFAELRQSSPTGKQVINLASAGSKVELKAGDGTGYGGYFNMDPASEGWSSNNSAAIYNQGDGSASGLGYGQVIDFHYGGTLTVTGGSLGNANYAEINNSSDGMMLIGSSNGLANPPANLPAITITGGASGGKDDFGSGDNLSNSAEISSEASSALTQIFGSSITINGYGGPATVGGAGIGANNLLLETPGNLTMYGGGSNLVTAFPIPGAATAAYIGADDNGINNEITIKVGGNISLTAGDGYGGAVLIGTVDGGSTTKIDIASYGGITLLSGTNSSVSVGNLAPDLSSLGGADVTIRSAETMIITGTDNGFVMIGSTNVGTNPTKVTLGSMHDITVTKANVGGWNGTADTDKVAVYGGYMDDGAGNAIASGYGGTLSFTRTRLGGSLGDAAIALYAAASGASGGDIGFSDGGGAYGASITINAAKDLTLTAVDKGVRLQATSGPMSITAGNNFTATGGTGVNGALDVNMIGQPAAYNGAGVAVIAGAAGQTINVTNTMQLQAGSIGNANGSGSPNYGGSVTISSAGNQTITAGTLQLLAGTAGHDNVVQITGQGVAQNINVTTLLELTGGGGGNNNYAWIGSTGANGAQKIDVTGSIVLTGGASGGAPNLENGADISLFNSNVAGSQTVYAGSILINGGGDSTSYGGAGFGVGNARNQSFYVTGDLTMNGGLSSVGDPTATAAYIGSELGGGTITVQAGGKISLNGGTGTGGGVLIGSFDDSGGATIVNISAGKDITATGNTGGVLLGVKNLTGTLNNSVTMKAGWYGGSASGDGGKIDLSGLVAIQTDTSGQILLQASDNSAALKAYGGITLGAGTGIYGGPVTILGDANVALDGTVQAEGAVLVQGAGISIGAAGTVSSNATGDAISLVSTGTFTNNNYGGTPLAALNVGGRWLVYAADPASVTKNGMTSAFRQYSTVYLDDILSNGNGFIYATAPGTLNVNTTVYGGGLASHTFGATPAVFDYQIANPTVADDEDLALITAIPHTAVTFTPTITAATNVGPYTISYASGLTSAAGYSFAAGAGLAYNVNPAVLQIVAASLQGTTTKVYDSTNLASLTSGNFLLTGFVGLDSATVTKTTGIYDAGKNVGTGLSVSTTLLLADFLAGGTTNLGNYTLPTSAQGNIGSISAAPLTVTATSVSRQYNGTTTATGTPTVTAGTVYGSDVLSGLSQSFASKNVMGTGGSTLNVYGGYTLTDGNIVPGNNYALTLLSAPGTITAAPLTITAVSDTRQYNGTTNSAGTPTFNPASLYGGDTLTGLTQSFASKSVYGAGLSVLNVYGGYTLADGNLVPGSNYAVNLVNASGTITKAPITAVTGITAANKVYDGNATATLNYGGPVFTGIIYGHDVLTVAGASGQFVNGRNVGTGNVNINNITLGADGLNYSLPINFTTTATAPATITQLPSVTWSGGSGNWSSVSNWGGALPDGQNVATVVIPSGKVVTFNSNVVPTTLTSLNSSGGLVIASGSLAVNSVLTTSSYQQTGGSLTGTGSFTVNNSFSQTGGSIVLSGAAPVSITQTAGNARVGSLSKAGGTVTITANNAILDENGDNVLNITAANVNLTSINGGAPGSLAISLDTAASNQLTATVSGGNGGIYLRNFTGSAPATITLTDNGISNPGIQFYQDSGLSLSGASFYGGSGSIVVGAGGSMSGIESSRFGGTPAKINLFADSDMSMSGALDSPGSNILLSAIGTLDIGSNLSGANLTLNGAAINVSAPTQAAGDLAAAGVVNVNAPMTAGNNMALGGTIINVNSGVAANNNIELAATTININSTGNVDAGNNVALVAPLFGGTINLDGGVTANGTSAAPSTINGIPYSGIAFVAQNLNADGGHLDATDITGNISGLVSGSVTLKNGAYFSAGNDIELVLAGGDSTVSLSNGSHFLADYETRAPRTIFLDFLTRSSGGVMIDGVATTTSLPGGSGFFVTSHDTPAKTTAGGGLEITYANAVVVDPCASSPDLCKLPSPIDNPIIEIAGADPCATSPDAAQCKAKSDEKEKEKGQFGDEDTGNKNEKSSQKKVAQCT
jgi:hypothetical protein